MTTREIPASSLVIDELIALCRRLRLKYVREQVEDVVLTARAQRWDPAEMLRTLLVLEAEGRDRSTIETKRRRAHFPTGKTFESWIESRSSITACSRGHRVRVSAKPNLGSSPAHRSQLQPSRHYAPWSG